MNAQRKAIKRKGWEAMTLAELQAILGTYEEWLSSSVAKSQAALEDVGLGAEVLRELIEEKSA